jgi:hypothetical protein
VFTQWLKKKANQFWNFMSTATVSLKLVVLSYVITVAGIVVLFWYALNIS